MRNFLLNWLVGIVIAVVFISVLILLSWMLKVYPAIAVILIILLLGLAFADLTE